MSGFLCLYCTEEECCAYYKDEFHEWNYSLLLFRMQYVRFVCWLTKIYKIFLFRNKV